MNKTFQLVYEFLKWFSKISGFTYHEVNIIVYFIIIPAVFIYLIGSILKRKVVIKIYAILVLIALILIPDFELFSTQLFNKSVDFLNWFDIIGLNYVQASVVICVIIPIIIVFLLVYYSKRNLAENLPKSD
uniref:hypothetical protein n=1 Tax=Flavobacterium sp. TaxID=239 RepID=UPI0040497802